MVVTRQWQIIERRRIVYEPEPTRFIYHHVLEVAADAVQALIDTARTAVTGKARQEIEHRILAVRRDGRTIRVAGVPGGNNRVQGALSDILAAHTRIHAVEGCFYRDALADACEDLDLSVKRTPERDLWAEASKSAACSDTVLRDRIDAIGKKLGPPWGVDQKLAALAAFCALE